MPRTAASKLIDILKKINVLIPSIESSQNYNIKDEVKNDISSIISDLEKELGTVEKKSLNTDEQEKMLIEKEPSPPQNFRELSVIPTMEDLYDKNPFLRSCKYTYTDVDTYLDINFRLWKEDYTRPLRNGLKNYLEGSQKIRNNDIRVYKNVRLINYEINNDDSGFRLNFGKSKYAINWERSKRLQYGAFLLLSKDNFKTIVFATIVNRDKKNVEAGIVIVEPCLENDFFKHNLLDCNLVMIESKLFSNLYFPVLEGLKNYNENNFPMQKYFIKGEQTTTLPRYLKDVRALKFKRKFSLPLEEGKDWPSAEDLKFDKSQLEAFKNALTQDLAIIQGPPGTGKTFLSLQIVSALLENKSNWIDHGPIVVVCFTNHALDQFLEGILQYTNSIVRLGSRSKSETLQKYSIMNKRKFQGYGAETNFFKCKFNVKKTLEDIQNVVSLLEYFTVPNCIIPLDILQSCINDENLKKFGTTEDLARFLIKTDVFLSLIEGSECGKLYIDNVNGRLHVCRNNNYLDPIKINGSVKLLDMIEQQIINTKDYITELKKDVRSRCNSDNLDETRKRLGLLLSTKISLKVKL